VPGRSGPVNIQFQLDAHGPTTLVVFDVAGRRVRTLIDGILWRGEHGQTWDGRDDRGLQVARGIYFLELKAHGRSAREKVLMLR